jgi:type I restriction enzyme S subunit
MWRAVTLGEVCTGPNGLLQTGPFGSQLHADEYTESGVAVVMPQDLDSNRINHSQIAHISTATAHGLPRHRLDVGDIVWSRRGDITRRALVRSDDLPAFCGTGCLLVRPAEGWDARFLSYRLATADVQGWLAGEAVGATMPNLNTNILSRLPVTAPPLPEQQAIAEVLGALDDKIAANQRLCERLLDLARLEFTKARRSFDLIQSTYGEIAAVAGGGTPRTDEPSYWNGGIPWLTPTDVTGSPSPYLHATERDITEAGLAACASGMYGSESIMMTSRATIGALALPTMPTAMNQGFIAVTPNDPALKWWLFHEMETRVPEYLAMANGATFLELSRATFKAMSIRVPSHDDAEAFAGNISPLHAAAHASVLESRTLASLRDTLLPALMSGRLRVRDAEKQVQEAL